MEGGAADSERAGRGGNAVARRWRTAAEANAGRTQPKKKK